MQWKEKLTTAIAYVYLFYEKSISNSVITLRIEHND